MSAHRIRICDHALAACRACPSRDLSQPVLFARLHQRLTSLHDSTTPTVTKRETASCTMLLEAQRQRCGSQTWSFEAAGENATSLIQRAIDQMSTNALFPAGTEAKLDWGCYVCHRLTIWFGHVFDSVWHLVRILGL